MQVQSFALDRNTRTGKRAVGTLPLPLPLHPHAAAAAVAAPGPWMPPRHPLTRTFARSGTAEPRCAALVRHGQDEAFLKRKAAGVRAGQGAADARVWLAKVR